jgi:hypothetical protein
MRLHSQGDRYLVLDDVLPSDQFATMRESFGVAPLRPTLSAIDRFHDGLCFTAPGPEGTIADPADTCEGLAVRILATHAARVIAERPR